MTFRRTPNREEEKHQDSSTVIKIYLLVGDICPLSTYAITANVSVLHLSVPPRRVGVFGRLQYPSLVPRLSLTQAQQAGNEAIVSPVHIPCCQLDVNGTVVSWGHSDPVTSPVHNGGRVENPKAVPVADFESDSICLPIRVMREGWVGGVDH